MRSQFRCLFSLKRFRILLELETARNRTPVLDPTDAMLV
jgi:hypothetical protein